MDEARAVLRRLRRIDALERERASASLLLAEVHALLVEAEAWLAVEGAGADDAARALEQCRDRLGVVAGTR
jgi:hypothetical protein